MAAGIIGESWPLWQFLVVGAVLGVALGVVLAVTTDILWLLRSGSSSALRPAGV